MQHKSSNNEMPKCIAAEITLSLSLSLLNLPHRKIPNRMKICLLAFPNVIFSKNRKDYWTGGLLSRIFRGCLKKKYIEIRSVYGNVWQLKLKNFQLIGDGRVILFVCVYQDFNSINYTDWCALLFASVS